MVEVSISLGSNLPPQEEKIISAIKEIKKRVGKILRVSKLYRTRPLIWPGTEHIKHPEYLNAVIITDTKLEAEDLLKELLLIETKLGRVRTPETRWEPRNIDLDILFYGSDIINSESLTVPHPLLQDRDFVLAPLCDIHPNFIHPKLEKSIYSIYEGYNNERFVIESKVWEKIEPLLD